MGINIIKSGTKKFNSLCKEHFGPYSCNFLKNNGSLFVTTSTHETYFYMDPNICIKVK